MIALLYHILANLLTASHASPILLWTSGCEEPVLLMRPPRQTKSSTWLSTWLDPSADFLFSFGWLSKIRLKIWLATFFSAEFQLTNLRLVFRLAEFLKSQQHSCTCVCSVIHKGVFSYENIDANKMYVCIFKHSFL